MQILAISPRIQYCRPIELSIHEIKPMERVGHKFKLLKLVMNQERVQLVDRSVIASSNSSKNREASQNAVRVNDSKLTLATSSQ